MATLACHIAEMDLIGGVAHSNPCPSCLHAPKGSEVAL
jgi:hypothetical protein